MVLGGGRGRYAIRSQKLKVSIESKRRASWKALGVQRSDKKVKKEFKRSTLYLKGNWDTQERSPHRGARQESSFQATRAPRGEPD